MPIEPSISLNAKAPDSMSSLASVLDIAKSAQSLKKQQATFDADVAQRNAESNVAVQTQQPLIEQQQANTQKAQTSAQNAQVDLHSKQVNLGLRTASGLLQDPDIQNPTNPQALHQKLQDAEQLAIRSGADPKLTEPFFQRLHAMADANPGQVKQALQNSILQAIDASGQHGAEQPNYISTGSKLQQTNPTGIGPQAITATVAPGQQDTLTTDPTTGGAVVVHRNPTGAIVGAGGVGGSAPSNGQPGNGQGAAPQPGGAPITMNFPAGETAATQQQLQEDRQATNEVARGIPTQMDNISQSLHVLDQPGALSKTGTGAGALAKIAGTVGVPVSGDYAANYNTIAHALALQSGIAAKSMGAGTDAARAVQEVATGSVGQDPVSLRMALTTNRALLGGASDFNNGQEKAVQAKGIFGARQFKNDWSNNFNVELYRLHTAADAGDKKTVEEVTKRLGPDKLKALSKNWQNIQSLINTGSLPNGQ